MKTKTLLGCWALATLCAVSGFAQSVGTVVSGGLLSEPNSLVIDGSSNIYITDAANNRVLKYVPASGSLTVLAGSSSGLTGFNTNTTPVSGTDALFYNPQGMVAARGGLVVADSFNNAIRYVGFDGTVTNIAGSTNTSPYFVDNTNGLAARFLFPVALAVDSGGNIYVADFGNKTIRKIANDATNKVTTVVTLANQPTAVAVGDGDDLWVADRSNRILLFSSTNGAPKSIFTYSGGSTNAVGTGAVGTNDAAAASATFNGPKALLWMGAGAGLLVSDSLNHSIRRVYTNAAQSTWSVITVGGVPLQSGLVDGATNLAKFNVPIGLANDPLNGAFLVADSQNKAIRLIQQSTPLPAISDPQIGTVSLVTDTVGSVSAKLTPIVNSIFNNDVVIAIQGQEGTETLYTFGDTPTNAFIDTIPDPGPGSPTAPFYRDGGSSLPATLYPTVAPDMTVKAIGSQSGRRPSAVVKARFQFKTGSPVFVGDNAASFSFNSVTTGAEMFYTTDGVTDPTNGPSTTVFGPVVAGQTVKLTLGTTNILVKVRAFKNNYQASEIVSNLFSPTSFSANKISFGFPSGVASSDFIGSAGQTFAAPVTLTLLPGQKMYSLQFNLSVTNSSAITPVVPGAIGFTSRLMKPLPSGLLVVIPPAMSLADASNTFTNLLTTNTALNLLSVGWLEVIGRTNLYDTTAQDLMKFSLAHDTLFDSASSKVVAGNFFFQIPTTAVAGETYTIRIGRPSATSDGLREDVFIDTPTNGALTAAGPINSIKTVTVGTRKYLVGDVAPFRWYNAGDYGDTNLLNNDVLQVFNAAVYSVNRPPAGTDFFDAMDSCNGTVGVQSGNNTTINAITLGDGSLNVDDVFVTFRRSLDGSLSNYFRYWSGGVRVAELYTGSVYRGGSRVAKTTKSAQPLGLVGDSTEPPAVSFAAGDAVGGPGQTLQVPITAQIVGAYPLRVLALNITVKPLDGSPVITDPVQFTPAAGLGQPQFQNSFSPNNYAAVWLDEQAAGITGTSDVGVLRIKLPANAPANAAYAIVFDHVSASPNGLRLFAQQVRNGLVTLANRSASSFADGLPDSWRLRYFGSVSNLLAQANADADGDGIPNWAEFKAGTNPNDAVSKFQMRAPRAPNSNGQTQDFVVRWASVSGKQYVVECSASLFSGNWTAVSPTLTGTGWDMEFTHVGAGNGARFYRVRVLDDPPAN